MTGDPEVAGEAAPKKKKKRACERCGNFARRARLGGRRWCLECLDRCDPIERGPIDVGSLVAATLSLASRAAPRLLVPALVYALLLAVIDLQLGVEASASLLGMLLGGLWGIVVLSLRVDLAMAVVEGRPLPETGALFAAAGRRFGALFGLQFVTGLVVGAWSLLLVIPGIVRGLDLTLAPAIFLLEDGHGVSLSMSESTARMRGSRVTAMLAGAVLMGVPMVAIVAGLGLFPMTEVRVGAVLLLHLMLTFIPFVSMALYVKLRWAAAREKLAGPAR